MTIDGITIDEQTDFRDLADGALRGRIGSSTSTSDAALSWLFDAWPQLRGTNFTEPLVKAIGTHLTGNDVATKHAALLFFVSFPDAGALALAALQGACGQRQQFRGVFPPGGGSADLEWWLMRAIASLAAAGAPQAMQMIEREALRADGKVEPILHTLIRVDANWFAQHRGDILRLHPDIAELVQTIESMG